MRTFTPDKTIKISEFIKNLQNIHRICGDIPVLISCDSEGIRYGTITKSDSYSLEDYKDNQILVICPDIFKFNW
jgi:hypothetical protein